MSQQNRQHKKTKSQLPRSNDNEEEESEPEEIQQITQINRTLPDKKNNYGIKVKTNGKYQNFTIDTRSPVRIMPNKSKLNNQKDIHPLKERYQCVNKNEIKFLEKLRANIEYNRKTTKPPLPITQRDDITPLLGVNWLKQLPITINKVSLDEHTQSNIIHTNSTNYLKRTTQSRTRK